MKIITVLGYRIIELSTIKLTLLWAIIISIIGALTQENYWYIDYRTDKINFWTIDYRNEKKSLCPALVLAIGRYSNTRACNMTLIFADTLLTFWMYILFFFIGLVALCHLFCTNFVHSFAFISYNIHTILARSLHGCWARNRTRDAWQFVRRTCHLAALHPNLPLSYAAHRTFIRNVQLEMRSWNRNR
jgi:hypothetical protein